MNREKMDAGWPRPGPLATEACEHIRARDTILSRLRNLDSAGDELSKRLDDLEARLAPILSTPPAETDHGAPRPPCDSMVATELEGAIGQLRHLARRVAMLNERIDL